MRTRITLYKPLIDNKLHATLKDKEKSLSTVNQWAGDVCHRLVSFVTAGKTIRGSLVLFVTDAFGQTISEKAIAAAAALELIHSGLLIQDDIMDRDRLRRGNQSMYAQFDQLAIDRGGSNSPHFGDSMAINVSDVCFFLGYELLEDLKEKFPATLQMVSQELSSVVIAQMQDVSISHIPTKLSKNDILSLYRYKTARYSFSLPLRLGAMLAGAHEESIGNLEKLGEHLGILFQIRDDELNITGDRRVTGKPTGTDRANRKQTLASVVSEAELTGIRNQLETQGQSFIAALPISEASKRNFRELLQFCSTREK